MAAQSNHPSSSAAADEREVEELIMECTALCRRNRERTLLFRRMLNLTRDHLRTMDGVDNVRPPSRGLSQLMIQPAEQLQVPPVEEPEIQEVPAEQEAEAAAPRPQPRPRSRSPREPFTREQDAAIVRWLLDNNRTADVGGNAIWKQVSEAGIAGKDRPVSSLQAHWRRVILPRLGTFGLSPEDLNKFN